MSVSWSQADQEFVHWQKSVGAKGEDALNDMVKDVEGNVYVSGSIQTLGSQTKDVLVSKYSPQGHEIWSKIIGKSGDDRGIALELLNNTLFVLCSSNSSAAPFLANSGQEDIVLLQLNLDGQLQSSSRFGGNFADIPTDISKTTDGQLLISAHSRSTEGDLDSNKGQSDIWALRVDASGSLLWKKNFGGSDEDYSSKIIALPNGEIVVSGHSSSFDGDIMMNYGDFDLSLFKLSPSGDILWEQNYGGLQAEFAVDLLIKDNASIILAGNTQSLSYDISKNAGFSDAWVIEVDAANGGILWEETHGSEYGDYASALSIDESNQLFLMGTTNAPVFQGELSSGSRDSWLAKVNSPNSIDHLALYGGDGFESINDFAVEDDGSILLIGSSNSTDNLFSDNKGKSDGWIMKVELNDLYGGTAAEAVSAHPNPTSGTVYLNNLTDSDEIIVYSASGQLVDSFRASSFTQVLDLTNVSPGVYLVRVERMQGSELIRVVKN
ncbi:MAG: T9SS type A sorting domain-containing protein [Crocinitomicaceae bacterium]|nr:T9SS type A sorting domain-containing protein [Crocinitomicaceae bacterium]